MQALFCVDSVLYESNLEFKQIHTAIYGDIWRQKIPSQHFSCFAIFDKVSRRPVMLSQEHTILNVRLVTNPYYTYVLLYYMYYFKIYKF